MTGDPFAHHCQQQDDLRAELAVAELIAHLRPFTVSRIHEQPPMRPNRVRQLQLFAAQRRRGSLGRPRPPLSERIPQQRQIDDVAESRVVDALHAPTQPPASVRTDIQNSRGGRA